MTADLKQSIVNPISNVKLGGVHVHVPELLQALRKRFTELNKLQNFRKTTTRIEKCIVTAATIFSEHNSNQRK